MVGAGAAEASEAREARLNPTIQLKRMRGRADLDVAPVLPGVVDSDRVEADRDFKTPKQTLLRHNSSNKIKGKH